MLRRARRATFRGPHWEAVHPHAGGARRRDARRAREARRRVLEHHGRVRAGDGDGPRASGGPDAGVRVCAGDEGEGGRRGGVARHLGEEAVSGRRQEARRRG